MLFLQKVVVVILVGLACFGCRSTKNAHTNKDLQLVWSDEFDGNGLPDTTKWGYDLGDGCPNCGWGNNELQYYTANRTENARRKDGLLVITARKEAMGTKTYTSARMVTKNKGDWKYGRVEVRAKLPVGRGVWPAIWMLPTDWKYGGWPRSGEIDIMENVGYLPDSLFGTVHIKSFNHLNGTQKSGALLNKSLSSDFHTYRLDWNAEYMDFFFDGKSYFRFTNNHSGVDAWPFDQRFHLVLNLAVGGNWGGKMGVDEQIWPQEMQVDWVRVYQ
jgi:beta-glucanase (GH16 family)